MDGTAGRGRQGKQTKIKNKKGCRCYMAINTIELATEMTGALDKAVVQKPVCGFFADNALRAKFVGAATVTIPSMDMSGLGDYDRDTGFVKGAVTINRHSYTLAMDRGRTFQIDAQDEDESGIPSLAGEVSGEFVRTKVCPEIDAYCLSKLSGYAAGLSTPQTVSLTENKTLEQDIYRMFLEAREKVQNAVGYDEELVWFVNAKVLTALQQSTAVSRMLDVTQFKKGDLQLQVKSIDGVPILPVPDSRMKTAFTFLDGADHSGTTGGTDESAGGFTPATSAKSVGFLLMPRRAASLVRKTDTVRIFEPSRNPSADAWKIDYRVYYDLLTRQSMLSGIYTYVY